MGLNQIKIRIALTVTLLIGMIAIMPICDANLAFMANNNNQLGIEVETTFGTVDVPIAGHVGFGYQKDDGKFVFGSFGPSPGNLPLWAPGTLTVETFDDWAAVERYLITNYYTTYKTFNVDNPNPQSAWDTMERFKGSYYNLLTSVVDIKNSPLAGLAGTNSEHPDSENCLTFAKKVLEAYGVKNLPPVLPFITSAPNNYFLSVPEEIHSTISDIEQESTTPSGNKVDSRYFYNGHYYEIVRKTLSWNDAKAYAESQQFSDSSMGKIYRGYLAIIASPDENSWIVQNILSPLNVQNCVWLGGYRDEGYGNKPSEGWHWLSNEPWSWTNWDTGEPNNWNNADERYLAIYTSDFDGHKKGTWNDLPLPGYHFGHTDYSLIEYE